jgi:hypothetical protein
LIQDHPLSNALVVVRVLLDAGGASLTDSGASPVDTTALVVVLSDISSRGAVGRYLSIGLGSGGGGGADEGSRGDSGGSRDNRSDRGGSLSGSGGRAGRLNHGAGDLDVAAGGAGDVDSGGGGRCLGSRLGRGGGGGRRRSRGRGSAVNEVLLEDGEVGRVSRAVTWLQAVHVRSPPGTGGPPLGAHPDVAVLGHVGEHAVDGSLAVPVDAAGELADEALLVVFLQPGGGGLETLLADGAADAGLGGSGAVTVQVLVHLVDNLVLGVREGLQVVVVVGPGPGAAPGVAFDEDVLAGGASGTDSVNGSLVKVQDEGLVKVVVLVV